MGFVHSVEPFVDVSQRFFGDTEAGVFNGKFEGLMVRIQGHPYPAVFVVVFDGIFNQVRDKKGDLNLVNLGCDLSYGLKGKLNV